MRGATADGALAAPPNQTIVTLNLFQGSSRDTPVPCRRAKWMLKRVQGDG